MAVAMPLFFYSTGVVANTFRLRASKGLFRKCKIFLASGNYIQFVTVTVTLV